MLLVNVNSKINYEIIILMKFHKDKQPEMYCKQGRIHSCWGPGKSKYGGPYQYQQIFRCWYSLRMIRELMTLAVRVAVRIFS
jgi:hypothetical protein